MFDLKRFKLLEAGLVLCLIAIFAVWMGNYMIDKWERIRDSKRSMDVKNVENVLNMYNLHYGELPNNEYSGEWDETYNSKSDKVQILFNSLRKKKFISGIFDPMNGEKYYYRYHKFNSGEYGCRGNFAIFQIMSFEGKTPGIGYGACPERDFAKEAPNGYTLQIFE